MDYLRAVASALVSILAVVSCSEADERPTVAIFNLMSAPILNESVAGIEDGLAARGYDADRIRILKVNANGEFARLPALAEELVRSNPDVIVPISTPVTQATYAAAGPDQTIVYCTVTNPSDIGFSQRDSNITGVSDAVNYSANIDLIFELFPQTEVVGMIFNPTERNSQFGVEAVRNISTERGFHLRTATVSRSDEISAVARTLLPLVDVVYVGSDNTLVAGLPSLLNVANEMQVPVIASGSGEVEEGALAAVSVDYRAVGDAAAEIIAELLRGGQSAHTIDPVSIRGEKLVLNLRAAGILGYEFPDSVLQHADTVVR